MAALALLGVLLVGAFFLLSPLGNLLVYCTLIVFLAAFSYPRGALLVSIALFPIYNLGIQWGVMFEGDKLILNLHLFYFVLPIAFCAWAYQRMARTGRCSHTQELTLVGGFFVAWASISWLWTTHASDGIPILIELFSGMIVFLILSESEFIKSKKELKRIFAFLLCVGLVMGVVTIVSEWYANQKYYTITENVKFFAVLLNEKGRAAGFTGVNHAATVLNFFIFIGLYLLFTTKGIARFLAGFVILFLMVGVIATGSKSGFVALLIGLGIITLMLPARKGKRIRTAVLAFVMIAVSFVCATYITTGDFGTTRVAAVGASFSYETRFKWWSKGFNELLNTTCGIGLGAGGFRKIIKPVLYAHNIFLSTLFDLGVVGFLLFLLLLTALFVFLAKALAICRDDRDLQVALSCMIAAMIGFLMNNLLQGDYYMRSFWMMLGLDAAIINMAYAAYYRRTGAERPAHALGE